AVEGAEDDAAAGGRAIARVRAGAHDAVVGIAASGATPFVRGALAEARRRGAATVFLAMNARGYRPPPCDCRLVIPVGPEVLAGSTRLKAGTATKLALNALTTSVMVLCGRAYGNVMVDLRPGSHKLRERALRILAAFTGLDRPAAAALLARAGNSVKLALAMQRLGLTRRTAAAQLAQAGGSLRRLIGPPTAVGPVRRRTIGRVPRKETR
ncbi:MAG: N-acetylmuramic acid 6-phosphate etherase, partial [Planctomycetes bacterium]|nr:N-acetylmuramic acid 6-phosphate etherase [Planctomycetota bacterium]